VPGATRSPRRLAGIAEALAAGYVRFANRKSHLGRLRYRSQALSSHICTANRITSIESVALIEMVMSVSNMAIHSALFVGMLKPVEVSLRPYG
jgi:hypothetical protein